MAKADGSVLISLDIDDNTKAPIEKVESRLKGVGSGAGDKIDDSMKANAAKAEETAKKTSNVIEGDFKKPVTQDIKVDAKQAEEKLKAVSSDTAKLVKGDNNVKFKVSGDASKKIKDIYEDTNKIPKSKDIDIDAKGNAPEKIKETASEMDNASNKSLKLKDVISGTFIGGALTQGIGMAASALGGLGGEAVTASDAVYKFQSTMKLGGFGSKEIKDSTKEVQKYANDTVYDLATVSNTTAQLAANGVKGYMGLTEAAGNLNAQAGGNADTFKSVAMMLTQTAGAGKLTTENWNQLADAIPGASGVLQKQMKKNGAYTGNFRDAMAAGKVSSDEFNKAVTQLGSNDGAKKAAASTKTFEGSIGNLEAGVVTGIQNIIGAFGKDKITGAISSFSGIATKGLDSVAKGVKGSLPFINTFGAVLGGVLKGAGSLLSGFASSFKANLVMPVSGKQVTKGLDNIKSGFDNIMKAVKPVLGAVGGFVGMVAGNTVSLFATAVKAVASGFKGLSSSVSGSGGVFKAITSISGAFNAWFAAIKPVVKAVGDLAGAIGGQLLKSGLKIIESMAKFIAKLFGATGSGKHGALDAVAKVIEGLAKNKTAVKVIADSLIALMGYKMAKNGLSLAVTMIDKLVMGYGKLTGLPSLLKNAFSFKIDSSIGRNISSLKALPSTVKQLTPKSLGSSALTEGGTLGKVATGAAGVGVAASAGLDIYSAFKAKNPDKKFKNAGKGIGTAIGGGIGLFFGGPLGAAVGATIGKVIGGWGGKGAKLFTDGWNKKGKNGKPPKGFLPKAGYYARSGGDAIVGWAKGFARGVGNAVKSISNFNKKVGKAFGTVVKVISNVLKPVKKVLELALVVPIALVVGLAIKAWQKIQKPVTKVVNAISKAIKSAWGGIKSLSNSTWKAVQRYVVNPVKAVWNAINKYIVKNIVKGVKNAWKTVKSATKSAWNLYKKYVIDPVKAVWSAVDKYIVKNVVKAIRNAWNTVKSITKSAWNLIKKYAINPITDVWNKVKSLMDKIKNKMSDAMSSIKKTWHSAWQNVGDFFGRIWKSIKRKAQDGINGVISIINAGIGGIDKVIHAFGGSKSAIGKIGKVHFATGTGSLGSSSFRKSINSITPAVVNDEVGAKNPELIFRKASGSVEYSKEQNANTILMPGDEVANASDSAMIASSLGIEHFAKGGIGSFFSGIGSALSGAVSNVKKGASWLKNLFTTATKIIGHPIKSLEELYKYAGGGTKGIFKDIGKGAFNKTKDNAKNWWSSLWGMVDLNGGNGVGGAASHSPGSGFSITSGFGSRGATAGGFSSHDGVDFSGAKTVHAMIPGNVTGAGGAPAGWGGANGIGEYIATRGGGMSAIYQELNGKNNSGADLLVHKGDSVKTGQAIAKLGPSATHVHVGMTKHPMFSIGGSGTAGWLDPTKVKSTGSRDDKKSKKSSGDNKTIKNQVGKGFWSTISKLASLFGDNDDGSGVGDTSGGSITRAMISKAEDLMKVPKSIRKTIADNILKVANSETGNRSIMQQIHDMNSGGNEARGPLQYTPGTFRAYAMKGHANIMSPYDQVLAYLNNSQYKTASGVTSIWGNTKFDWLHSGPQGGRRFANGGIVNGLTAALLGEDPLHPLEHVINTAKPSSDGLLADAISTRAKNNPSGIYAKMNDLIVSSQSSKKLFNTQLQSGSSLQTSGNDSNLLKQMAKDMHTTSQKELNGDVYLGANKVGSMLDKRKNQKDLNSQYFAGQLKTQGGSI